MSGVIKTLECHVKAGFANRLRAMISAIAWGEALECSVEIVWDPSNKACMAEIYQLLDLSQFPPWVSFHAASVHRNTLEINSEEAMREALRKPVEHLAIHSLGQFYQHNPARFAFWLRKILPSNEVLTKMEQYWTRYLRKSIVGIHIRRGDNHHSRMNSPRYLFEKAIQSFPSDTRFFLATDDPEEKAQFFRMFPNQIQLSNAVLSRSHGVGMIHAVADWFLLASSKVIFGSQYSSFSEMAAAQGGCPLHIIHRGITSPGSPSTS